jgi:prepilin-type N-terminal cleavage/methylation domain-containing protein
MKKLLDVNSQSSLIAPDRRSRCHFSARLAHTTNAPQIRGFTIVELLVVIAIISILLAIILPAVQNARASARRTHCQNNLRQQSIAIQNHESQWRHIPTGGWGYLWLGLSDRGSGKRQPGGWIYNLLPFCEADAVYQQAPTSLVFPPDPEAVRRFAILPVPLLACPERRSGQNGPADQSYLYYGNTPLEKCVRSDYAINGGTEFFRSASAPETLIRGDVTSYRWPDTSKLNGVSFLNSEVSFRDVTDGTSQVIAVGEKWVDGTNTAKNGDDQPMYAGDCLDIRRWGMSSPARDGHELGGQLTFGSAHTGGAGFALCDGSVKVIPYYIDPKVFQQLCCRNDGEVVGDE